MWLTASLDYAGLASYRIPGYSSQYAAASPVPGPSTVKLALVSTAIQRSKDAKEGERVYDLLKVSRVAYGLPIRVALSSLLLKRLKQRKGGGPLETTYGIRGFSHLDSVLRIAVEVDENAREEITSLFRMLRYLGSSDSFVTCTAIEDGLPLKAVHPMDRLDPTAVTRNSLCVLLKDFEPSASFDQVNRYGARPPTRALRDVYYTFPILHAETFGNGLRYVFDSET